MSNIATKEELKNNDSKRFEYAKKAIERASMSSSPSLVEQGGAASSKLNKNEMDTPEVLTWALRERDFLQHQY